MAPTSFRSRWSSVSDDGPSVETDVPRWLDRSAYPFSLNRVDLPAGPLSYVDEGDGPTVLLLHGNPTWSFLYRHLIRGLADDYRCVAPDLPGFGLSAAPDPFSYRPAALASVVDQFADRLGLTDVTLVLHDWGGPVGMDWATRRPDAVSGVVAMNTWCWPRERAFDRYSSALTDTLAARWLYRRTNAFALAAIAPFVASTLAAGDFDRARLLARHYLAPLSSPAARRATWVLSGQVGRSRDWLTDVWRRRTALGDTPVRLLWGARDPVHGPFVDRWRAGFPRVDATVYDGVGHFVPEELGPALVDPVRTFLTDP